MDKAFRAPMIAPESSHSSDERLSSNLNEVETTNLAFLLGLVGGLLMLVLPVVYVQVYNGPPCVSTSACPTVPQSLKGAILVAGLVDIFTGIGAIATASMLKIRNQRRVANYGWALISLAAIHILSLTTSTLLSLTNRGVSGPAIPYFLGPLLVLGGGLLLAKKRNA